MNDIQLGQQQDDLVLRLSAWRWGRDGYSSPLRLGVAEEYYSMRRRRDREF